MAEATTSTATPNGSLSDGLEAAQATRADAQAQRAIGFLLQPDNFVGEVLEPSYEEMKVLVHDFDRRKVGGISSLSYLVATRLQPDTPIDPYGEHTNFILLRVQDVAQLADEAEKRLIKQKAAERSIGNGAHWDSQNQVDGLTHNWLAQSALNCRVIGMFYLHPDEDGNPCLEFGSDLDSVSPSLAMDVYKPTGPALEAIINQVDPNQSDQSDLTFEVGHVRYTSTRRFDPTVNNVPVRINPNDLRGQKTALFGMTRTGKSNTTKILAQSIYELRYGQGKRIGQIIFDPDGEYAQNNEQDGTSLREIHKCHQDGDPADVVTYGLVEKASDPDRRLLKFDFYQADLLDMGKAIIDARLDQEGANSQYILAFKSFEFGDAPPKSDRGATVRRKRHELVYRTLLASAGFEVPQSLTADLRGLFSADLLDAMRQGRGSDPTRYQNAANILDTDFATWDEAVAGLKGLDAFIRDSKSGYAEFDSNYLQTSSSGRSWADPELKALLEMLGRPGGAKLVGLARSFHDPNVSQDYSEDIYRDLCDGRLVIVDQSAGDENVNKAAARRIMSHLFRQNFACFTNGQSVPEFIVYVEEAHNILPKSSETDFSDVWVRTAKEGAKVNIGLVYATQEVTSIQKNILANTANWFVAHLNNTDETRAICKFPDFKDFEKSIQRATNKGFLRMKTLSNPFVVPVQIRKFEVNHAV